LVVTVCRTLIESGIINSIEIPEGPVELPWLSTDPREKGTALSKKISILKLI